MELTNNLANNELNWHDEKIPAMTPRKKLNIKCKIKTDPAKLDAFRYVEKNTKDGLKKSWIYHKIVPKTMERYAIYRMPDQLVDAPEAYCPNCLADLSEHISKTDTADEYSWNWFMLSINTCPVCGQALSSRLYRNAPQESYITYGVSVMGEKLQIWSRCDDISLTRKQNGLAVNRCVRILTVNTKTRNTYITIIHNKKKEVRKTLTPNLSNMPYETDSNEEFKNLIMQQFKLLTGIELKDILDIALINATRENVSWTASENHYYVQFPKQILKEIHRCIWRFDESKKHLAKALYPETQKNITLLAYSRLLPDNQRKLFDACSTRCMLVRRCRWFDNDEPDQDDWEEDLAMRERLHMYALHMVQFIHPNETTAVNRVIKWVNTQTDPDRLLMLFNDTLLLFDSILEKKGNINECIAKTLTETHDAATLLNNRIRVPNRKIQFTVKEAKYQKTVNGIEFRLPQDTHSLIDVGEHMHICVGGYGQSAVEKDCTIVVGYLNGREEVCIELHNDCVKQAKLFGNELPSGNTRTAVLKWAESCELKLDTHDLSRVIEDPITGEITFDNNDF